jgi:hypothetical protein
MVETCTNELGIREVVSGPSPVPFHNWLKLRMFNNDDIIAILPLVFYFIISTFPESNVQMKIKYTLNVSTFSAAAIAAVAIVVSIIVVLVAIVVIIAKVVSEAVAAKAVAEGSIPGNTFLKNKICLTL